MNKITLLLASTVLSVNAIAASGAYLKLNGGASKMNTLSLSKKDYDEDLGNFNLEIKAKSDITPFGEIAVGYSFLDNLRGEISGAYFFNPEAKGDSSSKLNYNNIPIVINTDVKIEANINTYMASMEADLFELGGAKVFIGAGFGLAQVKQKVKTSLRIANDNTKQSEAILVPNVSTKKANNFSYSLSVGGHIPITDSTHLVLAYSFRDFGKTKASTDSSGKHTLPKTHYKGHHLSMGVRFDI